MAAPPPCSHCCGLDLGSISHHAPLPALNLQLLCGLPQFDLQRGDRGPELGAALLLALLQFGLQVSVLSLQLMSGSVSALRGKPLYCQLHTELLQLSDSREMLKTHKLEKKPKAKHSDLESV